MPLKKNKFIVNGKEKGLGYLKGLNSHKDYSIDTKGVKILFEATPVLSKTRKVYSKKDLRNQMTPVRDQQNLGSCTAFAAASLIEYFNKKAFKKNTEISTLFTYKTTRNLLGIKGDTGAYLRTVMGSIVLFGTPPEEYYDYDGREETQNTKFDQEPTPFLYAMAQNYQSVKYLRLDQPDTDPKELVNILKKFLQGNYPVIFGFTCFDSLYDSNENGGKIPFPSKNESIIGGHAVCLAGFDDIIEIQNSIDGQKTKGAFIFKNSWGTEWGDRGYGYIPYKYFEEKLADDCWTLISQEYVDNIPFNE